MAVTSTELPYATQASALVPVRSGWFHANRAQRTAAFATKLRIELDLPERSLRSAQSRLRQFEPRRVGQHSRFDPRDRLGNQQIVNEVEMLRH
jgi:hypothetical protein